MLQESSLKGPRKISAADVRQRLAEHERKRAARGANCPVRARTADAHQRLAEYERKRAARGATCPVRVRTADAR